MKLKKAFSVQEDSHKASLVSDTYSIYSILDIKALDIKAMGSSSGAPVVTVEFRDKMITWNIDKNAKQFTVTN
jgi:hypothetical protein